MPTYSRPSVASAQTRRMNPAGRTRASVGPKGRTERYNKSPEGRTERSNNSPLTAIRVAVQSPRLPFVGPPVTPIDGRGRRMGRTSAAMAFQPRRVVPRMRYSAPPDTEPRSSSVVRAKRGQIRSSAAKLARGVIGNTPGFGPGIPSSSLGGPASHRSAACIIALTVRTCRAPSRR